MISLDNLCAEHRDIERMLMVLDAVAARLELGRPVPTDILFDVVEYFRHIADGVHHAKEERRLFPVLAEHGLSPELSAINALLVQHDMGRAYVRQMRKELEALDQGDRLAAAGFATSARAYVELLREHIRIEDQYLYPLAAQHVTAEEDATLARQFEELERVHLAPGQRARYEHLIAEFHDVLAGERR